LGSIRAGLVTCFEVWVDTRDDYGDVIQRVFTRYARKHYARAKVKAINTEVERFPNSVAWIVKNEDMTLTGMSLRGAKLNEHEVRQIKSRLALGQSQASIARDYGVHRMTINLIANGKTWAHVGV
jgi:hypothetical protein